MSEEPSFDHNPIAREWGAVIRRQRGEEMTQTELAERLTPPVHQTTVSQWERGDTIPRPEHQRQLIRILGIPPDDILRLARGAA